jgi:alpha-tubulin suppressor-like RCC1 family protein
MTTVSQPRLPGARRPALPASAGRRRTLSHHAGGHQHRWFSGGTGRAAGGYVHSLAETINGAVYGWGDNSGGELGNGTTTVATEPVLAPGVTEEH